MASKENKSSLEGQFKPRSPDLSASDNDLFAKETLNRRPLQISKKMEQKNIGRNPIGSGIGQDRVD